MEMEMGLLLFPWKWLLIQWSSHRCMIKLILKFQDLDYIWIDYYFIGVFVKHAFILFCFVLPTLVVCFELVQWNWTFSFLA